MSWRRKENLLPLHTTLGFACANVAILYIITSFADWEYRTITLRRIGDPRTYDATVVYEQKESGYMILKITDGTPLWDYGIFGSRVQISVGMDVLTIAHQISLHTSETYSFFIGTVTSGPIKRSTIHQYNEDNREEMQRLKDILYYFV